MSKVVGIRSLVSRSNFPLDSQEMNAQVILPPPMRFIPFIFNESNKNVFKWFFRSLDLTSYSRMEIVRSAAIGKIGIFWIRCAIRGWCSLSRNHLSFRNNYDPEAQVKCRCPNPKQIDKKWNWSDLDQIWSFIKRDFVWNCRETNY